MKVALIHDWLTGMRGGERVLEQFCLLYPDATLYTLIHHKGSLSPIIESMDIRQSSLAKWPLAKDHFRVYLPFFPRFIEEFDLSEYDLVLSSSHCVAKGVITPEKTLHVCFCHTPMRYVWDMYEEYKKERGFLVKAYLGLTREPLQNWDANTADRVDQFIANSSHVADRIKRHYRRDATVILPPVDTDFFTPGEGISDDYYLIVSALVPYKKVDMAVRAFQKMGKRLVVIGSGSDEERIRKLVGGSVQFLGNLEDIQLREYYRGARALIFPGEEDFGITPLESMACGRPVIAYGKGGALETVVEKKTGLFFSEQTEEALIAAVDNFERISFTRDTIRQRAQQFSKAIFLNNIREFVDSELSNFHKGKTSAESS